MRFVVGMLACIALGAVSVALADPATPAPVPTAAAPSASTTPSAPTSAAATPAPATAAAAKPQAAAAAPALDPEEKHLLAQGYRMQMRHGEKVFCRNEEVLGSRLGGKLTCGTAAQLQAARDQAREAVERAQRTGTTRTPGT